jgi:hypothetical protein
VDFAFLAQEVMSLERPVEAGMMKLTLVFYLSWEDVEREGEEYWRRRFVQVMEVGSDLELQICWETYWVPVEEKDE